MLNHCVCVFPISPGNLLARLQPWHLRARVRQMKFISESDNLKLICYSGFKSAGCIPFSVWTAGGAMCDDH